ncbi:MAG: S-adenosylmethionine:tRNA ribosyltransferase-isomerase [Cyanobacteriota bacterium]
MPDFSLADSDLNPDLLTAAYDYTLPSACIAQAPVHPRDQARMLVVRHNPSAERCLDETHCLEDVEHRRFCDLPDCLRPGDLLVLNDTKVIPARLFGRRLPRSMVNAPHRLKNDDALLSQGIPTATAAGKVEVLLLEPVDAPYPLWEQVRGTESFESFEKENSSQLMLGTPWGKGTTLAHCSGNRQCSWRVLVKPGKRVKVGDRIQFFAAGVGGEKDGVPLAQTDAQGCVVPCREDKELRLEATVQAIDTSTGGRIFQFEWGGEAAFETVLEQVGQIPFPPYIQLANASAPHRLRETHRLRGRVNGAERENAPHSFQEGVPLCEQVRPQDYQTVWARQAGSVAAPTAGLHFTEELLERLAQAGIQTAYITLNIGLGTFRPVQAERVTDHHLHSEWLRVPVETVEAIRATQARGGRVIAVGTTVARALETAAQTGSLQPYQGKSDLFIYPGYTWRVVQGLITNFHLPRSSLMMLVAALIGRQRLLDLYQEALAQGYRFYSFGDGMLILPRCASSRCYC